MTWAVRYLAHHTKGLDVVVIDLHHPARVVQVVGVAWLDSIRTALASHEAPRDVFSVVERVAYAAEAEVYGVRVVDSLDEAEMDW